MPGGTFLPFEKFKSHKYIEIVIKAKESEKLHTYSINTQQDELSRGPRWSTD